MPQLLVRTDIFFMGFDFSQGVNKESEELRCVMKNNNIMNIYLFFGRNVNFVKFVNVQEQ